MHRQNCPNSKISRLKSHFRLNFVTKRFGAHVNFRCDILRHVTSLHTDQSARGYCTQCFSCTIFVLMNVLEGEGRVWPPFPDFVIVYKLCLGT